MNANYIINRLKVFLRILLFTSVGMVAAVAESMPAGTLELKMP